MRINQDHIKKNMNNKNKEVSCLTGWSVNEPEENLMLKALAVKEKMLRTSRLYLKVDQTKMESGLKHQARTDHSRETQMVQ